jgi:hypothetical protein
MTDQVEVSRAKLQAAKNALDAARDAFLGPFGFKPESKAAYQTARERYVAALQRFSAVPLAAKKPAAP